MKLILSILLSFSVAILSSCDSKNKNVKTTNNSTLKNNDLNILSIDHVPVVVNDLEAINWILQDRLHFKIKPGREHSGIKNSFIKFGDGTYLEFTMPTDSAKSMGAYYKNKLAARQGGTILAIGVNSIDSLAKHFAERKVLYTTDNNSTWKTLMPEKTDLFYIEYADKLWKDNENNTTHPNNALGLQSVWYLSENISADILKFSRLGFIHTGKSKLLNISTVALKAGNSTLFLIDTSYGKEIYEKFGVKNMTGICGFSIKTNLLPVLSTFLSKELSIFRSESQVICFLNEYNFFLIFNE